jgi:hypothetical protein
MHFRGKAFEYQVKYPTGETEMLLRVPKYDFNWQLTYQLEQPLKLPKGTVLTAIAHYDNSPNNPYNPTRNQRFTGAISPGRRCWRASWISPFR